ncbi:hypothetical protein BZM26_20310 [Paraburkholderia strydomiana]|nr:hypothetical protein BZM26_20310 [Paraburkholderia strydomiana]
MKRRAKTVGGGAETRSRATPHEAKPWDQAGSNSRPKCIVGSQPAGNEAVGTEVPATKLPERKPSEALPSNEAAEPRPSKKPAGQSPGGSRYASGARRRPETDDFA